MWRFPPTCISVSLRTRSLDGAGAGGPKRLVIPGSLPAPYPDLREHVCKGGMLHELATTTGKRVVFYCAYGERSAMAVQAAQAAGITSACHIQGGLDAWKKAQRPLSQ